MRVAVVGHVEYVEFARVDRVPQPGEIVSALETWEEAAGGGAVAAVQLAKLAGGATLFTALGDDRLGRRVADELGRYDVRVEAVLREVAQRRAFTYLDAMGERTITVIGERLHANGADPLPWHELDGADGVYVTAADHHALRAARRAKVVVATSRTVRDLVGSGVRLDALVGSGIDPGERYDPGALDPPPALVVRTGGATGGTFETEGGLAGAFDPAPLPGEVVDAYGCGDSFAAGLTYGLAAGMDLEGALGLAARCGAACLTGRGPYAGQLRLS